MEPSVSFREKKLSDEVLFQMIRGFNGIRLTDDKDASFVCAAETGLLPIFECLSGISIHSIGWIFSVWANRTMQEDLSVAA